MYEGHGMDAGRAAGAAAEVMRVPATALVVHAREELGIDPGDLPSPVRASLSSLVCFLFGAVLPLIPWFFGSGDAVMWALIIIGVLAAAVVGALVGKFAERRVADHGPPGRHRAGGLRDHLRDR